MPEAGFITIEVDYTPVRRKIATFGMQINDLTPAWQRIALDLQEDWLRNFESEGSVLATRSAMGTRYLISTPSMIHSKTTGPGGGWADLAPSTVVDRIRQGFEGAHPILYRTGSLLASVVAQGAPGNVTRIHPDRLEVGTNYWTAAWHQQGTSRMPDRPIVGIAPKQQTNIVNRIREYVQQLLEANAMK